MMESYEAFADYNDIMALVEELLHTLAVEVLGSSKVDLDGETIDFTPPWPRTQPQGPDHRAGRDRLPRIAPTSSRYALRFRRAASTRAVRQVGAG